jgi:arabinose-5-phosphate isomerase
MVNPLLKRCSNQTKIPMPNTPRTAAIEAIKTEAQGLVALLHDLEGELGSNIEKAVTLIKNAKGRVIVSGMGKSGHIGRKIAATLASTGTPAMFVHPAEASHGDLGMITESDVVIMLSNSGESAELKDVLTYCTRFSVPMIAVTAKPASTLGLAADIVLRLPAAKEACPNGQAPTTSTLLQLALGDGLAMALLQARGFSAEDFRNFHPGGKLGARIKHARDIMHQSAELPVVTEDTPLKTAVRILSDHRLGCVGVTSAEGKLTGIVTDGDIRRHLDRDFAQLNAADIMTKDPVTISGDILAAEVIELINARRITAVFVVDGMGKPEGLIHIHDLLREGVS